MGRIQEPELQALAEAWTPAVTAALAAIGEQRWPPHRQNQGFLKRPRLIPRFAVEGPAYRDGEIWWAASHTLSPSAFDKRGTLTQGEREYWIVRLSAGESPCFHVEGAQLLENVPAQEGALKAALAEAFAAGPKHEQFYGNKGPLNHR